MPTLYCHTHCKATQANAITKVWQRVCLFKRTPVRQTEDRIEGRTGDRRLAQWRVRWLIEHSTLNQLLWCIASFVLRNPPLRQAPKR